jgi:hypothetical protein
MSTPLFYPLSSNPLEETLSLRLSQWNYKEQTESQRTIRAALEKISEKCLSGVISFSFFTLDKVVDKVYENYSKIFGASFKEFLELNEAKMVARKDDEDAIEIYGAIWDGELVYSWLFKDILSERFVQGDNIDCIYSMNAFVEEELAGLFAALAKVEGYIKSRKGVDRFLRKHLKTIAPLKKKSSRDEDGFAKNRKSKN